MAEPIVKACPALAVGAIKLFGPLAAQGGGDRRAGPMPVVALTMSLPLVTWVAEAPEIEKDAYSAAEWRGRAQHPGCACRTLKREKKNPDPSERIGAFREAGEDREGYLAILYFVALIAAAIFSSVVLAGS